MATTPTADDGALLRRAVCSNPADDTARLVYADWLTEHGEEESAEFIRVQCELARGPAGIDCTRLSGHGKGYDCFPAAGADLPPIGAKCVTARVRPAGAGALWTTITGDVCGWVNAPEALGFSLTRVVGVTWRPELSRRERELWEANARQWRLKEHRCLSGPLWAMFAERAPDDAAQPHFVYRRGFAESLTCTAADFLAHAKAVFRAHPVTAVRLADSEPLNAAEDDQPPAYLWVRASRGDSYFMSWEIPFEVWGPEVDGTFDTTEKAHEAASRRCVAFGRLLVKLPPLPAEAAA